MIMTIKQYNCLFAALVLCLTACKKPEEPTPEPSVAYAFPEASGGGRCATGGRGGEVFYVTSLEDKTTPGTLRYAVSQPGAKTIVFNVAGTIHLTRALPIIEGDVTIAGQTAPGDGICIAGYPVVVRANNVVMRFLRFRMGDNENAEGDALSINESESVIVDHCSFSWSTDECVSCYGNKDFTLQYCFITESLRASVHDKGNHGYGGIWGGTNASFHHNLLAHHDSRNPRFDHDYVNIKCAGPIDYVNNVVYNWGSNSTYGGEGSSKGAGGRHINMVNNYYKSGPATNSKVKSRLVDPWTSCDNCTKSDEGKVPSGGTLIPPVIYLTGNYMHGNADVTADNWKGSTHSDSEIKTETRWTDGLTALTKEETAEEAFETVLSKAGCSLARDAVDARIVEEVRKGSYTYTGSNGSKGGIIDSQSDVGGWPELKASSVPADTDEDGMPDAWENEHGLDYLSYGDGKQYTLDKSYTNLEVYLNSLVQHLY